MKRLTTATGLFALSGGAWAHVAELPLLQHALEHGWLVALLIPLLLLLLPLGRERRR
jgi:hypothetical protein